MSFTRPATTETQIRNFLINTIWSALEPKIDTKMNNNFYAGWSKFVKLKVNNIGGDNWQIYPKFHISGTTNLNGKLLRKRVSDLLKELKTELTIQATGLGATNVKFHIHYPDGRAQESDDF